MKSPIALPSSPGADLAAPCVVAGGGPLRSSRPALPDCPLCGANGWPDAWKKTRLRRCRGCSTILNDRSATREEEERRYETYSVGPSPDERLIAVRQWEWLKRRLPALPADRPLSVLDVGCGHGAFLNVAREEGCRVAGIDLDPTAVATCRQLGLPVRQGSLFDAGAPPGPWDVITMWDVLEHLEHPREALDLIVQELAPGAILVLRGRNPRIHASLKVAYAHTHGLMAKLGIPDPSILHRWGLTPSGYAGLLAGAGMQEIRLHPGVPTPGDRCAAMGPRMLVQATKGLVGAAGTLLHGISLQRLYPFPSVLISGRKPIGETASDGAQVASIRYRRAQSADIPWIAAMHFEAARRGVRRQVAEPSAQHRLYCDKVRALLEIEPEGLLVAESSGEVVAFIQVSRDYARLRQRAMRPTRVLLYALRGALGRYGFDYRSLRRAIRRALGFWGARRRPVESEGETVPASPRPLEGHILSMVVVEEMRRRGIATRLMDEAATYLRLAGHTEMCLEVAAANEGARAAYERYGFTERTRYRDLNGEWLVLSRQITPPSNA